MDITNVYAPLQAKGSFQTRESDALAKKNDVQGAHKNVEAWETAQKFEAAFISQMLTYSGLAKALTDSGGEDVAGFSQFYLESLAKDMTETGGFGLAEKIYAHIEKKENAHGDLGRL